MLKSRIALRLLGYFAAALCVMALISGILFQALFTRQTVETKKAEMLEHAGTLANTLSGVLEGNGAAAGQGTGYGAYLRLMSLLETDVWVLDENLDFLTAGHSIGNTLTYSDLPADADALVQAVFSGETPFSEGFSDLLGTPTLTVGVPIYDGDSVAGALLLHDAVSGITSATAQGMRIMAVSGAAALVSAALLAVLLSLSFARPLDRMKATALKLTAGDYTAKTGVAQKDEIGKLATAMDGLSDRLLEAEQAAARQEKLRRNFLSNVSHELRTPVTVLRGSLEALCEGVVTAPEQVAEYHGQMLKETLSLQRLVNDLMDLARLQNVDFPIEDAPISLSDILSDALHSAGQLARQKHITLTRQFPPEAVPYTGDYGRLKQMFLIILDNAVKFSPENSTVTVTLTPHSITIQDEGVGISAEDLPLIFDRFHKTRSEANKQGSGLGLAIAKQIAQRHHMEVTVESEIGKGTAFHFTWA